MVNIPCKQVDCCKSNNSSIQRLIYLAVIIGLFFSSIAPLFAVLDTIFLQYGTNGYTEYVDRGISLSYYTPMLKVGRCWGGSYDERASLRFGFDQFKNIKNPIGAVLLFYLKNQTGSANTDVNIGLLSEPYRENSYRQYRSIVSSVFSKSTDSEMWYHFDIPLSTINDLIDGTIDNNGFELSTSLLSGKEYDKCFIGKETSDLPQKRAMVGLIVDQPKGITVLYPNDGLILRPTKKYTIVWHSSVNAASYKIELLKSGSPIEVIADKCTDMYFEWFVNNHCYVAGKDYSIRVSSSSAISSGDPVFEIETYMPYLTVDLGDGDGFYYPGDTVKIFGANPDKYRYVFDCWSGNTAEMIDVYENPARIVMGNSDLTVKSVWIKKLSLPGTSWASIAYNTVGSITLLHTTFEMHSKSNSEECYLDYNASVTKTGEYYASFVGNFIDTSCYDSITVDITNIETGDTLLSARLSDEQKLFYMPMSIGVEAHEMVLLDTVFLKKGDYKFRMKWSAYPFERKRGCNIRATTVLASMEYFMIRFFALGDTTSVDLPKKQKISVNKSNLNMAISNSLLYIENSGDVSKDQMEIAIYNVVGEKIEIPQSIIKRKQVITLKNLSNGVYIVKLNYGGKIISKKITLFR